MKSTILIATIAPKENIEILKNSGAKVSVGQHEHRKPIEIFEPFFKEVLNDINKSKTLSPRHWII